MDPIFDPRVATWYLAPEVYEQAYRGSVPPSDYLSRNRQIKPLVEPDLSGMSRIYREFSASPNEIPVGPWEEGKPFQRLKEGPRAVQRPPNFPPELLNKVPAGKIPIENMTPEQINELANKVMRDLGPRETWEKPPDSVVRRAIDSYQPPQGMQQRNTSMPGIAALIPILMSIQGSSDPNVMKWYEAQRAQTPPDQARSTPDMLMALQQLQQGPQQPIDPNGMLMMEKITKPMPKAQVAQPPADVAKIQELADMIYQRRGRD